MCRVSAKTEPSVMGTDPPNSQHFWWRIPECHGPRDRRSLNTSGLLASGASKPVEIGLELGRWRVCPVILITFSTRQIAGVSTLFIVESYKISETLPVRREPTCRLVGGLIGETKVFLALRRPV